MRLQLIRGVATKSRDPCLHEYLPNGHRSRVVHWAHLRAAATGGPSRRFQVPRVFLSALFAGLCIFQPSLEARDLSIGVLDPSASSPDTAAVARARIGERLFFDRRLSADGSTSCTSCHEASLAYTDGRTRAVGSFGRIGVRNAISLLNVGQQKTLFWDGRRDSLEAQALDAFTSRNELGNSDMRSVLAVLRRDAAYVASFKEAYGVRAANISESNIADALAAFERTLVSRDSAFDRFYVASDQSALTDAQRRGMQLFSGRAQCATCHQFENSAVSFSDGEYHATGVGIKHIAANLSALTIRVAGLSETELRPLITSDESIAALGRFLVTKRPSDIGKYKTPSLRNVTLTAPYMHDGSVASLEEAVDRELYYRSIELERPLVLTPAEKSDLLSFLASLTGDFQRMQRVRSVAESEDRSTSMEPIGSTTP